MGTEVLVVPEENVAEVVYVIRKGLNAIAIEEKSCPVSPELTIAVSLETKIQLTKWCENHE